MLHIGLMWFDDTPKRSLSEKIRRAANQYESRHGRPPNICYLNDLSLTAPVMIEQPIRVVGVKDILPFHFWVGEADFEPSAEN